MNFLSKLWQMLYMLAIVQHKMTILETVAKKSMLQKCYFYKHFEVLILFFCHDFHECHFVLKFCKHAKFCQSLQPKKSDFFILFTNFFKFYSSQGCIWSRGQNRNFVIQDVFLCSPTSLSGMEALFFISRSILFMVWWEHIYSIFIDRIDRNIFRLDRSIISMLYGSISMNCKYILM